MPCCHRDCRAAVLKCCLRAQGCLLWTDACSVLQTIMQDVKPPNDAAHRPQARNTAHICSTPPASPYTTHVQHAMSIPYASTQHMCSRAPHWNALDRIHFAVHLAAAACRNSRHACAARPVTCPTSTKQNKTPPQAAPGNAAQQDTTTKNHTVQANPRAINQQDGPAPFETGLAAGTQQDSACKIACMHAWTDCQSSDLHNHPGQCLGKLPHANHSPAPPSPLPSRHHRRCHTLLAHTAPQPKTARCLPCCLHQSRPLAAAAAVAAGAVAADPARGASAAAAAV
jgi:hypothetical protein